MSTQTLDRIAPYELLADAPAGTRFTAGGKLYTLTDGFQIEPEAGKAWFNATGANGRFVKVHLTARTPVTVLGRRY